MTPTDVDLPAARSFLREHCDDVDGVELVGEGAWSRCFGFRSGTRDLVVRFGRHRGDFDKDRRASRWRSTDLPIPEVLDIGEAFGEYYAISTRAYGVPLESLDAAGWRAVMPELLRALNALRTATVDRDGRFGAHDYGHFATWRDYLLAIRIDAPGGRTHGWQERLRESDRGTTAFAAASERLEAITRSLDVTPTAVHNDLVNRNVLVDGKHVSGIFDWGCTFTGDFLYDVATIVFWTPWYAALDDVDLLGDALTFYSAAGAEMHDIDRRLKACALHIGLVHIGYNAYLGDWDTLDQTAERTEQYIGASD